MNFRTLNTPELLQEFQREFHASSGVNVPLDYFVRAQVTGMFDEADVLSGGYSTAPGRVGRWFKQIPVTTKLHQVVDHTLELNAVWLKPGLRGRATSAELWTELGRDLASRDVEYIVFAVNVRRMGLMRLYERIGEELLYEGPVVNSSFPSGRYFYATPERFAALPEIYRSDLSGRRARR